MKSLILLSLSIAACGGRAPVALDPCEPSDMNRTVCVGGEALLCSAGAWATTGVDCTRPTTNLPVIATCDPGGPVVTCPFGSGGELERCSAVWGGHYWTSNGETCP